MSRKNTPALSILCALLFVSTVVYAATAADPILRFYWMRARSAYAATNPIANGTRFSLLMRTYDKRFHDRSGYSLKDSLVVRRFYSFGLLDSSLTIAGNPHKFPPVDLAVPDPFDSAFVLNSFPNDTGGALLPIGFDTDSAGDSRPVGLAELDRTRYLPRWLYLYYPSKSGYRRFSRSFRFIEYQGLLFPDSVWEVSTQDGLLFTTHRRLETGITDIVLYR